MWAWAAVMGMAIFMPISPLPMANSVVTDSPLTPIMRSGLSMLAMEKFLMSGIMSLPNLGSACGRGEIAPTPLIYDPTLMR